MNALQKVSAASKIGELFDLWRIDRECFLQWKAFYLKTKQIQVAAEILDSVFVKKMSEDFTALKSHVIYQGGIKRRIASGSRK